MNDKATLKIGTLVRVTEGDVLDRRTGGIQPGRVWFGQVAGYDMGHSKYRLRSRIGGMGRYRLTEDAYEWAFPGQVSEVTEEVWHSVPEPYDATAPSLLETPLPCGHRPRYTTFQIGRLFPEMTPTLNEVPLGSPGYREMVCVESFRPWNQCGKIWIDDRKLAVYAAACDNPPVGYFSKAPSARD